MKKIKQIATYSGFPHLYCLTEDGKVYQYFNFTVSLVEKEGWVEIPKKEVKWKSDEEAKKEIDRIIETYK